MGAIAVIDYGMGNLRSVSKALEALGAAATVTDDPVAVAEASKVVLPGVGAFDVAMRELTDRGLVKPILKSIAEGKPYLGICLGLQLLFESSDEGQGAAGFCLMPGAVRRLPASAGKIPHMGWNQVQGTPSPGLSDSGRAQDRGASAGAAAPRGACPLLHSIPDGSFFYFVHSYAAYPADPAVTALETDYGGPFASMVWKQNVYATQFHPEKSQAVGLTLLKNFVAL